MNSNENLPTVNNNNSIKKGHTMYNWETHDDQDKVIHDSINAINRKRDQMSEEQIKKSAEKIFQTETGKRLVKTMFYPDKKPLSETWAQDALQDLEDFIEEQGIYIRQ